MISIFQRLSKKQEETGIPFQTAPIRDSPNAIHRLAFITAVIERHYLDSSWVCRLNKGSVTFQHTVNPRWVVKVFLDEGNRLAKKLHLAIHPEPTVVGIDLTDKSPFERTAIRQHLRSHFDYYIDPEAGRKDLGSAGQPSLV